jgi:hypothetical protein
MAVEDLAMKAELIVFSDQFVRKLFIGTINAGCLFFVGCR